MLQDGHENLYRIQYEDRTWLGKKRPVRTKKAARIFREVEKAHEVARNMVRIFPTSKLMRTWLIIIDYKPIKTRSDYWDCECDNFYIHHKKTEPYCPQCDRGHEESPDSRVEEVEDLIASRYPSIKSFPPLQ